MIACLKKQDALKKVIKEKSEKTECTPADIATIITETALMTVRQDTAKKNNKLIFL